MVNENEPVKCPDCSVWWRGLEHKCKKVEKPNRDKIKDKYDKHLKPKGCPLCGATGVHYCQGKHQDTSYTCGWCGKKTDYRYSHYCDSQERYTKD